MLNPKITVILPVYGVEKYIGKCARSLFSQSYDNIEIIFVNDGTKDRSIEIVETLLSESFPHMAGKVRIIHKENAGLPAARKTGLEAASGDYILYVDPDDCLADGALEKIARKIEETDADIVYFDFYREHYRRTKYKYDGRKHRLMRGKRRERDYGPEDKGLWIRNIYNYVSYGYLWIKCFRKSIYDNNPIFIPAYSMQEDEIFSAGIIHYARTFAHLKDYLYYYNQYNGNSITARDKKRRDLSSAKNMIDVYEHYKGQYSDCPFTSAFPSIMYRLAGIALEHEPELLDRYPFIAEHVLRQRLSERCCYSFAEQLVTKFRIRRWARNKIFRTNTRLSCPE